MGTSTIVKIPYLQTLNNKRSHGGSIGQQSL